MRLLAAPLFVFLMSSLATAHAAPGSPCADDDVLMRRATLATARVTMPVSAHFCYRDKSGDYVVYLTGSGDRRYDGAPLSSKIGAYLFKINPGPALEARGTVNDSAEAAMAGIQWWTKLTELTDIDGDGLVDPILVYRFYDSDDGQVADDPYWGRLKIIAFHRDAKAAIRAVTGPLDGERSTTASAPYFKLPAVLRTHLVAKIRRLHEARGFAFDDSYAFRPQR